MKTVLILVLSSDFAPYDSLMQCSQDTWDSIEVKGTETVFYCGQSVKPATEKIIYMPFDNSLYNIGRKTLCAFEWALKNKQFDYLSRPNASSYINKKELINYIATLPDENVFDTLEVVGGVKKWGWGVSTLLSKDVVQKIVDAQRGWDHKEMEDVAMSQLVDAMGIPYRQGRACSIDKLPNGRWRCTCYGSESFEFDTFDEIVKAKGQYWFRCKQDYDRNMDEYVMKEIFKALK